MNIQENISLKPFNTFGIDAQAKYMVEVKNIEELKSAITFAKDNNLEILFLGGGSNILLTKNFDGLAISLQLKGITEENLSDDMVLVTAKAGENWHQFVLWCIEKNYGGLENLSLIPGNIGTCPMQNIGAYGVEIKDHFHHCIALNLETLELETFSLSDCNFGYRESYFKHEGKGKYVIVEVGFSLTKNHHKIRTEYGAIQSELQKMNIANPNIKEVSDAVIRIRESKLPNPKITGNAGSFFKNPIISISHFEELKNIYPDIPHYPSDNAIKIPAGWLIEQSDWKGKQIGNVATHPLQALVIINATGNATGKEIYDFSENIIQSIKEKYNILLEREVNIL